jgi:cephalosporin-C deacetylase
MPLIDMPLEQLKKYEGRNPKPVDFDEYWDRGLEEMHALDPALKLEPADFQCPYAECFDLTFTGVGGARVYAKYLHPKNADAPHPALLRFHGYSANSGHWTDHLAYVAAGFCVLAMDCRGQGGRSNDAGGVPGNTHAGHIIRGLDGEPEDLLYRAIFLDCAQLACIAMNMDEIDADRVGAHGGSQGGGLTIACAALEPRVKRLAPVYPFLSDYRRVWEMDLAANAYDELKRFFRYYDPRHEREDAIFERLGYIDIQHLAPRIKGRVLMGTGLMDNICPPSTQFAAYNKMHCEKDVVIYPDFGHENLPGFNDQAFEFFMEM